MSGVRVCVVRGVGVLSEWGTGVWWFVPIVCCPVSTIVYGTGVVLSGIAVVLSGVPTEWRTY